MSAVEREFAELLAALPVPSDCSYASIVDAVRDSICGPHTEDKNGRMIHLSLGFDIFIMPTQGDSGVVINKHGLAASDYPGLREIARDYASKHQVSLESYYFSDTNSGMFGFDTLNDTRQVDTVS